MAPPKQLCQLYADGLNAYATALEAWESVKKTFADLRKLSAKLKFGIIDVSDFAAAETINAISSIAASISDSVTKSTTKAAAAFIEAILSEILKILLAFPTAIFSLVAIPHRQAIDAVFAERSKLNSAQHNITTVLRIMAKWTQGFGGSEFYSQIVQALPYIQRAIRYSGQMVLEMSANQSYEGGPYSFNANFNEGVYKQMKGNINQAVKILAPKSFIAEASNIVPIIQKQREKDLLKTINKINAKYETDKRLIDKKRSERINSISNGSTLDGAIRIQEINNEWAYELKRLDVNLKIDIANANMDSMKSLELNKSSYYKAKDGLKGEFMYDMEILGNNLLEFLTNMQRAFENHKTSQMACYTCYSMRRLISRIISDIIGLLRNTGNNAAIAVVESLRLTQASLNVANDRLSEAKGKYETTPRTISSTQLSVEVSTNYGLLKSIDSMTSAAITGSVIDMINVDDIVQDADDRFDKFIDRLSGIKDWDGKSGIWVPDPVQGVVSPYLQIIADATTLVAMVPSMGMVPTPENRDFIKAKIKRIQQTFGTLRRHNSEVNIALTSYSPYVGSEVGNLFKLLSNAGLLSEFAIGMNITSLIDGVVKAAMSYDSRDFPSFENCYNAYGETMFPDIRKSCGAVSAKKNNLPARETYLKFVERLEEKLYKQKQIDINLKSTRFLDGHSDDDLQNDNDAPLVV